MKCPKCHEEIKDGLIFCTNCGAKLPEDKKTKNEEKKPEESKVVKSESKDNKKKVVAKPEKKDETPKSKKAAEDQKKLKEIRKQEKIKMEEKIKEAEKQEAIRQAKQEGIELEIIDKEPEEPERIETPKRNVKYKEEKTKKEKKKKVKIKKNIFQKIFNKLIFMIVVAAIIIGGVYYCYKKQLLPDIVQEQVRDFDYKLQNVINSYKDVKNENYTGNSEENKENWEVEPNIEADNIEDLDEKVSAIVKDKKYGIIDNKNGEILLEAKYTDIFYGEYTETPESTNVKEGIIVKDIGKYYVLDSNYKIGNEVTLPESENIITYYYDHHGEKIYEINSKLNVTEFENTTKKELKLCTDIDIVSTEGEAARNADLPESFTLDVENSTETTKGYFDTSTGKLIINCDYDKAYEFNEGYAAVKIKDDAGYIDESGNRVIELKYDETRTVHDGLAFVKKDGKWGILKIK